MTFINKFLAVVFLIFIISTTNKASDINDFKINVIDNNTFILQLVNVQNDNIQVRLKDSNGTTMHDEALRLNSIVQRKYNLQNLPLGNYNLVVSYDSVIKVQSIKKSKDKLVINTSELQTIFKPSFRQHSEYLDLNMLSFFKGKIELNLQDSEGRVIYSEIIISDKSLKRRFNLSLLDEGMYTFSLSVLNDDSIVINDFNKRIEWSPQTIAYQN